MSQILFDYTKQDAAGACSTAHAWAKTPAPLAPAERNALAERATALLQKHNAVLVAHYYVDGALQDLALATGGIVADSLEMARFGRDHAAQTLVVAGVRFMGETAKILSPEKRVLMPDLDATCSLDLGCPAEDFAAFCDAHPDRTVVVYANTSAAVKARADWMVTSSCALEIVSELKARGEKILWAPDRHLGRYIQEQTGADMLMWNGACIVHDEFKGLELEILREQHPGALVLVHPESPKSVVEQADVVGSTSAVYRTIGDSTTAWRRGTSAAGRSCLRQAFVDEFARQGETARISIERIALPVLGVERAAHRLTITGATPGEGPAVTLDVVLLRRGRAQAALLFAAVVVPPERARQS